MNQTVAKTIKDTIISSTLPTDQFISYDLAIGYRVGGLGEGIAPPKLTACIRPSMHENSIVEIENSSAYPQFLAI